MKRFLSILLASLLIISSFSTIALAEDALVFELVFDMLEGGVVKAGAKVQFNVEAADNATVTYYNNGVEVTPTIVTTDDAETAGLAQTVALPVNAGINKFTAKVGDTESAAITVKSYAYNNVETIIDEAELLSDTNATTFESVDVANRTGVLKLTAAGRATANQNVATVAGGTVEVTFDAYFNEFHTGGSGYAALMGPYYYINTTVEGLEGKNIENGMNQFAVINSDGTLTYPYTKGELNKVFKFETGKWYNISYYIDTNTQKFSYYIDGVLYAADLGFRTFSTSSYDIDGDDVKDTVEIPSETQTFSKVNTVWANMWNNNDNAFYIDNFAMNTQSVGVPSIAIDETLTGDVEAGTKIPVTVDYLLNGQKVVANINGVNTELTAENGAYNIIVPAGPATIYAAILNADGAVASNLYTGKPIKSGTVYTNVSSISIDNNISGDVPVGSKILVTTKNIAAGNKIYAYVNGVEQELTADAQGNYSVAVPAGYNSIYAAVKDSDGDIAKDFDGNDIVTDEITLYGLSLDADTTENYETIVTDDFSAFTIDTEKLEISGANVSFNLGSNNAIANGFIAEADTNNDGNTDAVKLVRKWYDKDNGDGTTTSTDSGAVTAYVSNALTYTEFSVDYKFEGDFSKLNNSAAINNSFISIKAKDANGTNDRWYYPFGISKSTTPSLILRVGTAENTPKDVIISDIDLTQWHKYGVIVDPATDKVWLYIDGILRLSGLFCNTAGTTNYDIARVLYPNANLPKMASGGQMIGYIDNYSYCGVKNSVGDTAAFAAKPTAVYTNDTANGIGVIVDNLTVKPANLAVIADLGANGYQVQTFDASATSGYKYFAFKNPASKIMVWDWNTLCPISDVIIPSAE
ncbi:MAG: hypothetical protein IJN62_01915 [Clostridia bacterium]|nr:hypothetical protein [Clostridia bacterium]